MVPEGQKSKLCSQPLNDIIIYSYRKICNSFGTEVRLGISCLDFSLSVLQVAPFIDLF